MSNLPTPIGARVQWVMNMTDNPLPEQLASKAENIVNTLTQTDYQSHEKIDTTLGIYDCDCNGFVGFVLDAVAPEHFKMIPKETTQLRPRAFKYFEFFVSLTPESPGGWHRIDLLRDARRGDIMAWRFPEIKVGHNTGHVLFLAETPVVDDSGHSSVRVYDSAAQAHFDDTRATGKFPTGVGTGFIHFQVDAEGKPIAFQFAPSDGFETFAIAIGRVEPLSE